MPEICRFLGIVIYMYREVGGKHHFPHIHAAYSGKKSVFNIETAELIEGNFSGKEKKLVEAWIELRKEKLRRNWAQLNTTTGSANFFKVDPIK